MRICNGVIFAWDVSHSERDVEDHRQLASSHEEMDIRVLGRQLVKNLGRIPII